jgi:signal transduction histidine kinase
LILKHQQNVFSIAFAGLSYGSPATNRYRYRLEGLEPDWNEVGSDRRQAIYTTLPSGTYTFRAQAATKGGPWSEPGVALRIEILPPLWRTRPFQAAVCTVLLLIAWAAYRQRLNQVARQFAARLAERTRIARDLHDTLLQSFQALMLHLQVVDQLLPEGKAKEQLEQTLKRADQAIAEGRSAVYDLRSSTMTTNDLAPALTALGKELGADDAAAFHLVVEGTPRDLHPIIRDELYRIAREAIRNAFKHAHAHDIEAEITYLERLFRLRIRDDGEGIAPEMLDQGRPGHYGLAGMSERAKQIGAKLSIWSGAGAGTEIELSVPASGAYTRSPKFYLWRLFREKVG